MTPKDNEWNTWKNCWIRVGAFQGHSVEIAYEEGCVILVNLIFEVCALIKLSIPISTRFSNFGLFS